MSYKVSAQAKAAIEQALITAVETLSQSVFATLYQASQFAGRPLSEQELRKAEAAAVQSIVGQLQTATRNAAFAMQKAVPAKPKSRKRAPRG